MNECKHEFKIARKSYYKLDGKKTGLGLPAYDQSIEYTMLYCIYCAYTREIMSADHNKKD